MKPRIPRKPRRSRTPKPPSAQDAVVAYVRVSTAEQANSGLSLASQRERCIAYARALDLRVVDVIEDAGHSAKSLLRPGLQRVVLMLEKGEVHGVLVAKLDRLTRNVRDLGDLIDRFFARHVRLLSVGDTIDTSSAAGRLMLNVLTSVAQWEREAIGERTATVLAMKKSRREKTGGLVPYGFRLAPDGVHLVEAKKEQGVVELARALHAAGMSYAKIAEQLTLDGLVARSGKPFVAMQVFRMVTGEAA